jgi:DNA-binding IclR family transcriptional regulator
MKITHQVFCVNQLSIEEFQALELAEKVIEHIQETYGENCRLTSPNDGECIIIDELSRVRSILDFVMRNRVVEVDVA